MQHVYFALSFFDKMSCLNVIKDVNLKLNSTFSKKLPLDIIDHILKFLPWNVLFQLRVICKHWNTLPTLDNFCNSFIGDQNPDSYLIRFQNYRELEQCDVYNMNNNKFVKMDFTFALKTIKNIQMYAKDDSKIKVIGALWSGGLLCMKILYCYLVIYIFVCNPITKVYKCIAQCKINVSLMAYIDSTKLKDILVFMGMIQIIM